ncbi:hypothetical protein NDU88_002278 [Pleurodeles waltl]|uniref:Secreted protein n=1 Tax=Pleurodeles waltl TaxID=8319 RepID=A0AAV7NFX0_PLEWA|nr:hypothetical protein NDU88_002278 [Pleurodeles waltl]
MLLGPPNLRLLLLRVGHRLPPPAAWQPLVLIVWGRGTTDSVVFCARFGPQEAPANTGPQIQSYAPLPSSHLTAGDCRAAVTASHPLAPQAPRG